MTGLELLKAPASTVGELADVISQPCPPAVPEECDRVSCRECWLTWLITGEAHKGKGPSDEQTALGEGGMHPNLKEHFEMYLRQQRRIRVETSKMLNDLHGSHSPSQKPGLDNAR
jgi:hypothetical protein